MKRFRPEYILSTLFLELPSKQQYPDYYEVIKSPIALSNIKTKVDQQEYKSVGELKADIDLMVSNAKKYNIKESQVYQDAVKIHVCKIIIIVFSCTEVTGIWNYIYIYIEIGEALAPG